tara:strand:+ start:10953 stop:11126 length:174 start_codon:yes stop_codon:yes gene_type:complete
MEQQKPIRRRTRERKLEDLIHRIADIDTKVDHVIFRLKHNLHCAKKDDDDNKVEVRQ